VNGGADESVYRTLQHYSIATCCPRTEVGTAPVHVELEKTIAAFVGKPAAIVVGMGFATNSTLIPCLLSKGGLFISDQRNQTSIGQGARCSRAKIKTFKHNDPESLEQVIRTAIAEGQPGFEAYKPWKKIVILVEGLYSMEGSICRLPPIIEIKKRYNCYLWVDEAHSIGALGPNGKGVVEYWGAPH
jgi:serine palmitoyltransferase